MSHILDASTGVAWASGSHRSPIFYDSNNTAYYVDPAGATSALFAGNVGIGTTGPGGRLVVIGQGTTSGTYALNVTKSDGTSNFFVRDDGNVQALLRPMEGLLHLLAGFCVLAQQ